MVVLKYQCFNCSEQFDFDVGFAKLTSKHKLKEEIPAVCPKCNEKKLKIISTPEFEKLYSEFNDKYMRRLTINSYKPGKLVQYHKIFGYDKRIKISHYGKDYYIIDAYCVNPFCPCKTAYLNFYDNTLSGKIKYPEFSFVIDYDNGIIKETINIAESKAYEIYIGFGENLLKDRHEELKKEVQPYILKKFKNYFIPTRKLGRNEQCHCGSGKKYKKCCLENDFKKYGRRIRVPAL